MAKHYTATSGTYNHWKYGRTNTSSGTWTKVWYQMSIYVSVAGDGTCTYTITSTNNADDYSDWPRCQVSVWVEIGGETVVAKSFYKGDGFPRYLNSTKSGTLANKITGGTVSIKSRILPASDWNAHSDWWEDALSESTLTRNYWADATAPTCAISQKAGSNTITFSGNLGTAGHGNSMTSATLYYWMNGTNKWESETLTATSGAAYSKTKTCDRDGNIWAYVSCEYTHQTKSSSSDYKQYCYYYSAGGTPTCSISQSVGSNTVTISGNKGTNGSNNGKVSCTLYYNRSTNESNQSVDLGTSGSTYSYDLEMGEGNNNKTLSAYVCTDYTYGVAQCSYATSITSKYYSSVTAGTVNIKDNGNNTFTLTGTKGSDGYNNAATGPTLSWGYDTNYSNSFTSGDTKSLTIATPANATRTVYAKSVTGKTNYGSVKEATTSLAVKQYVAPNSPSNISLTYTKSRLTIRENWTLKWTGSTKSNDSSPVAGYRIRVWKNGVTIPFKNSSGEIKTNTPASTNTAANRYYYDRDLTSTEMVIDPVANGFLPGDIIQFTIHSYIKNGKGERMFSTSYATSTAYTVQNAGIARVKVGGSWKEGQVWIKTGGSWKEAVSVHAKVSGSWKEST